MKNNLKLLLPASLLVLGSILSGCSAGQQVTAADVIQKMRETMKTTQTAQSTTDISATINKQGIETLLSAFMPTNPAKPAPADGKHDITSMLPDTASAQIKTWKQSADGSTPAKARVEVVSSSLPGTGGLTFVFDGQKAYVLDPNRKVLYTGTPEKLLDKLPAEAKAALQGIDMEQQVDKVIDAAEIKLVGTEQVAGHEAYKLDITPKPDAAEKLGLPKAMQMQAGTLIKDAHATLWVDKDRWVPLKLEAAHPNIGTLTVTASTLDLNQPIDASTFVLQVGNDVKVVDLDKMAESMTPKTLTLAQARDAASQEGWKLLEATYPADATVVGVTTRGNGLMQQGTGHSLVTISYSSPTVDFTISQAKVEMEKQLGDDFSGLNNRDNALGAMKPVKVRGVDAVAFSPEGGDWTALIWQEQGGGPFVAIRGNLTAEEAVKIAEGLK
jgi:outer membrane lipoprotein-sorting protein